MDNFILKHKESYYYKQHFLDLAMTKRFLKRNENLHLEANLCESNCKMVTFVVLGRSNHSSRT